MLIISWLFLIIHVLFALLIFFLIMPFFLGAPFIPTPASIVREMVELANISENDTVVDLGSGDGRLLIAVAQKGARAIGWEINPFLVLLAKLKAHWAGVADKVKIHWGDYRGKPLSHTTVVFLFAITRRMPAIEQKLQDELKPGSRVISYLFSFPNMRENKKTASGIYCYLF